MTTQAQTFVMAVEASGDATRIPDRLIEAGAIVSHRFEENQFYVMADKSRVIVSRPRAKLILRAAPPLDKVV